MWKVSEREKKNNLIRLIFFFYPFKLQRIETRTKRRLEAVPAPCLHLKNMSCCQNESQRLHFFFTFAFSLRTLHLIAVASIANVDIVHSILCPSGTCVRFLQGSGCCFFSYCLHRVHLVLLWFTMNFTVCQKQSSDTVQFWCQPSPGLVLSSPRRAGVPLLCFKHVATSCAHTNTPFCPGDVNYCCS